METLHILFDSKHLENLRLVNKIMSQKSMDLGEALYSLQRNRASSHTISTDKSTNSVLFDYTLEWNISFRDNMKNTRNFIPTITIQIVRIEFPKKSSEIFLQSRIPVAEFSCLIVREGDILVGIDSEVRVFEGPCAGLFKDQAKTCAFLGQQWGKAVILLGALFCAVLGATQLVHTISAESRGIYRKYFEAHKTKDTTHSDDDHFQLPSTEALIAHVELQLEQIFTAIQNDGGQANEGQVLKYSNMYALPIFHKTRHVVSPGVPQISSPAPANSAA